MAEAIISRRGNGASSKKECISITITENNVFEVPKAIDNKFYVRIFGGGGGCERIIAYSAPGFNNSGTDRRNGYCCSGGGGGWMNNDTLILTNGSIIPITIGAGGNSGINLGGQGITGGTTSFGTYLSANGGGGASFRKAIDQASYPQMTGGCGGSGGGCCSSNNTSGLIGSGGDGYQFGGGGTSPDGLHADVMGWSGQCHLLGNGGIWGGGGGIATIASVLNNTFNIMSDLYMRCTDISKNSDSERYLYHSYGGTYGGDGGTTANVNQIDSRIDGKNGTNTIGNLGDNSIEGPGFGTPGTNIGTNSQVSNLKFYATGSGGGYGGCGGYPDDTIGRYNYHHYLADQKTNYYYKLPGGGGGYGANGGNGNSIVQAGGGGGGYIGKGGDGWGNNSSTNFLSFGGGGGGYGKGADSTPAGFAGGGSGYFNGGSGICIIQYYI